MIDDGSRHIQRENVLKILVALEVFDSSRSLLLQALNAAAQGF